MTDTEYLLTIKPRATESEIESFYERVAIILDGENNLGLVDMARRVALGLAPQ